MMAYERCVRKKLRSLFEYLDTDKDGRITPQCLQSGLIQIQSYSTSPDAEMVICEYEIEELLRCVPR
jgi:Ca2+-binding EF-hand superfamily protein